MLKRNFLGTFLGAVRTYPQLGILDRSYKDALNFQLVSLALLFKPSGRFVHRLSATWHSYCLTGRRFILI